MWDYDNSDISRLRLQVCSADNADNGTVTTESLCALLRSSQGIREEVKYVSICFGTVEESDCPDEDLEAVGNALHDLERFDTLYLSQASKNGSWIDAKFLVILRHVPKTKIRKLRIAGENGEPHRIPLVVAELRRGEWLACLTSFSLCEVYLDERDCVTLGQLLQSRQQEKHFWIGYSDCSFPSLKGYLVLADALIEFGRYFFILLNNTVKDASIPSSVTSSTHREFYRRFEREEKDDEARFNHAAEGHLEKFSALNHAGRLALLDPDNKATDEQWLDVLGNWLIRDSVDYLFHLLRLNPGIIHA